MVMDTIDRISNLNEDIIYHILQCLPLQDAIRTSILSTHWRCKWFLLPRLILNLSFFRSIWMLNAYYYPSSNNKYVGMLQLSNIVNTILISHHRPIHKFVLEIPNWFTKYEDVSYWICFVSSKLVKEITLSKDYWDTRLTLPSWMFSRALFKHLTHLALFHWPLHSVPLTFSGFPNLVALTFSCYHPSVGDVYKLGVLVSKCPLLENLDLEISDATSCLTIHAPNLKKLAVKGGLSGIVLEETVTITTLSLNVDLDNERDLTQEIFSCLPVIEKLVIGYRFWENYLGESGEPLPIIFEELKHLIVHGLNLSSEKGFSDIFCLLNMSPNLQILEITNYLGESAQVVRKVTNSITVVGDCRLDHLKSARINGGFITSRHSPVLQLVKLVLSSSPILDVITIEGSIHTNQKFKIAKKLLQCHKASANAKIYFKLQGGEAMSLQSLTAQILQTLIC